MTNIEKKKIKRLSLKEWAEVICRDFMESNVIEKDGYLSWREKRVEAIEEILKEMVEEIANLNS